ncbi:MAG: PD-(D/E)XK nuclease domain-containing protein [bacterium]|nr:PD-(D/E)XK nuclease domain-containing protein [bacterium]
MFLRPLYEIFSDMQYSYIIELKYLKSQATDTEVKTAVKQAQAQICRYADTVNVKKQIGHTRFHKVYVVYRGAEMVACEEIGIGI